MDGLRLAAMVSLVLMAGCASVDKQMHYALDPYIGKNVKSVVPKIGYPGSERVILGDTLYTWSIHQTSSMLMPTLSSITGTVGGTPFSATTTQWGTIPLAYECTITLATDADGTIKSFQWSGNRDGCSTYEDRLEQ